MKKFLPIILAIFITISITACGNKTTDVTKDEEREENTITNEETNNNKTNNDDVNSTEDKVSSKGNLASTYLNIIKSEKYFIKYRMNMEGVNNEISMAVDGKNIAMSSKNGEEITNVVIKDGSTYMINDTEKTVFVVPNDENETTIQEPITAYDELPINGEGTGEFLGRNLKYEEYEINGEYIRYYFDNDKIVGIESADDSGKYYIEILELTQDIPTEMFNIPTDYTVTDMSELY
jgi:predicted small lipoprotein YifL